MDKETRNSIERATQRARILLEDDFASILEGTYDILKSGSFSPLGGAHLSSRQKLLRNKMVAVIEHKRAGGMNSADAILHYIRETAFTFLNRIFALKMLESRELVQECISKGEQSIGYREFCGLAQGIALLPDHTGYRLYLENIFDELSTEVKVLFDRRDPASVLWPKRQTFEDLLNILNGPELSGVWSEDETLGWMYQFFNSGEERRAMREESQAPRNSRELAVRNQFFTPRYVVQFLTDNTLGCIWYEMRQGKTQLVKTCQYLVNNQEELRPTREKKDPRDLRILDPACGSGHFLLYAFELLLVIYEEAWNDIESPASIITGHTLREDYRVLDDLRLAIPSLVLRCNLHGVDIDPRCAQIAQLALWMRAQSAYQGFGIVRSVRPLVRRTNIVIAEPMPGEVEMVHEFAKSLRDEMLQALFVKLIDTLKLAGELGMLLRLEYLLQEHRQLQLFIPSEEKLRNTLERFLEEANAEGRTRRRLFTDDAAQGIGLLELSEKKYDVVLMNPPFGAGSIVAKKEFEKAYPKTKNDIYAAFVERGIELLYPNARLGAITSRTGFFLSSFQKWREEILLAKAPPVIFVDLGHGVLDSAMVETAAYCLEVKA
ncbi:hypothetical protein JCM17380_47400 [Desulfosporosinus burensis]